MLMASNRETYNMLPSDKSLIIEGLKNKTLPCNTDFNESNFE